MLNEQVVEYRGRPMSIVTINGRDYLPLRTFCYMTGLKADNRVFDTMADTGEIVERPATGRQRKPRRYISVDAWIDLWKWAFYMWLDESEREPEEIIVPWPWYGVKRVEAMLEFYLEDLQHALIEEGYLRLPEKGEVAAVKRDFVLTSKGEATEWLRYRMQRPSPFGSWTASVVIDMLHPDFTAFVADEFGLTIEEVSPYVKAAIEKAHYKREQEWRKRHPWAVRMREYESEADLEAESEARLEAIMKAHPGAFADIME